MTKTTNKPDISANNRQRLSELLALIESPRQLGELTLVDGKDIDKDQMRKVSTSGLTVGNYGYGDGDFFLKNAQGELYPVIDEFPVLIYPEKLVDNANDETVDLCSPQYEEAYTEMEHYNNIGENSAATIDEKSIKRFMAGSAEPIAHQCKFPRPPEVWVDALHDSVSQFEAYDYLAPLQNKKFIQLGGSGTHSVKALIGGAETALLLTPMLQEAQFAKVLAKQLGVEDRLFCVIAVGEEMPFKDGSLDAMYSGGCLHHMRTEMAFAEMYRVLSEHGRFSCVDPWKTVLHKVGTKVFGKREKNVFCRPIDPDRLEPINIFAKHKVSRHGPILRYLFLAFEKAGITLSPKNMMRVTKLDDTVGSVFGLTDKFGGSIVVCGEK